MDAHISRLVLFMPECTFLRLIYKFVDFLPGFMQLATDSFIEVGNKQKKATKVHIGLLVKLPDEADFVTRCIVFTNGWEKKI
jgi:hypothetical protein